MLTERLFIYGRKLNSLHDCLFDGLRFFAQKLGQVAFLPTAGRSINGAVFAYAQKQSVHNDLNSGFVPLHWKIFKQNTTLPHIAKE